MLVLVYSKPFMSHLKTSPAAVLRNTNPCPFIHKVNQEMGIGDLINDYIIAQRRFSWISKRCKRRRIVMMMLWIKWYVDWWMMMRQQKSAQVFSISSSSVSRGMFALHTTLLLLLLSNDIQSLQKKVIITIWIRNSILLLFHLFSHFLQIRLCSKCLLFDAIISSPAYREYILYLFRI